jgi:hypothetical protein
VPLITADEIHAHVETDRSPDAIALLVADAEAAIIARYGPHAPTPIVLERVLDAFGVASPTTIYLDRPAASVSSVSEFAGDPASESETVLEAADFRLLYGGRAVQRLGTGPHPRAWWAGRVVLTYVPVDDTAQRKRICIDLVKLALRYNAIRAQTAGDASETALESYTNERRDLLDELIWQSVEFS